MVGQITRGVQDFIGAARPSIADPFLPRKIDQGREDEIRECIGCNICRSANNEASPLRCTQNPTMGEEWRRGWHPEIITQATTSASMLVVGGGPAGLEAALTLARRGHRITLAEASSELGGRVIRESSLPGLQNWIRVRDYRAYMLSQLDNVDIYLDSKLTANDLNDFEADAVALATGCRWRHDGLGASVRFPVSIDESASIYTPDDIFKGVDINGNILIYDDDHYMMAGALAERFLTVGHRVKYLTPATTISSWSAMTDEQEFIQAKLLSMGIETGFTQKITRIENGVLHTGCVYSGSGFEHSFDNLVLVTGRTPNDDLFNELKIPATRIGDCLVPSSIADAVYSGHKFAREYGVDPTLLVPRRERAIMHPVPTLQSED
jgi:dimethylamine/trimethylamine dehydrogenase